jgi:serine/threonine-protein kinase
MSSRILAGRYELLERIGDGGMAVVYKARCRLLNRHVAIKILKPEFIKDLKFIDNFKRESQAAASLSHPNIVNIFDVGKEGNIHYIVMELVEGQVLSDLIKEKGPMEWRQAVEIIKHMASALSLAHKNHIIHRDVKPQNILITTDGVPKLADFGIAKAVNASTLVGATGTVMGSVHYFSPEQARGGYVDEKSDIYSLGIVLYELLTGRVPFDGENPVNVALMHINEEITPPSQLVSNIPPQLEQVVMKATKKYQTERFSTADEMLEALENVEHIHSILGKLIYTGTREEGEGSLEGGGEDDFMNQQRDQAGKKNSSKTEKAGSGKKRKWNQSKTVAILLALVIALPLSFGIYQLISNGGGGNKELEMPDFSGMLLEEAETMAEESGLKMETGDIVYSDEYEEGMVVSQTPAPTTKVKVGATVTVNLSRGSREGTVPSIVSKTYQDAVFFLEKYGYKVGSVSYENANQPEGLVLRQSPAGGEEAAPGSFVNFVVSLGVSETQAIVPLLVGMTESAATEALKAVNLALGTVTIEKNDTVGEGLIFWQSQGADTVVQGGTSIHVRVSGVPKDPDASYSIPLYIDFNQASNEVFYLTVVVSDEGGTHNILSNAQRSKGDGGGTVTLSGVGEGTVAVIFDTTEVARYQVNFRTGELY